MSVRWVGGHTPEFHLFEDGSLKETIDLSEYKTDEIHNMLSSKGFVRVPKPKINLDNEKPSEL